MRQHWTECDIEQSHFLHGNSLISVYNRHVARCLYFRSITESLCFPTPRFFKCPNEKIWCFETKLWSKINFSQHVQGYTKICLICACHRLLLFWQEKFEISFSSHKSLFVQSCPILMGQFWITLVVFIWQKRMHNEAVFSHLEKRGCGGLSL